MRWLETLLERRPPADETSVSDVMAQAFSAAERGDYASALELWEPLAHSGVARAQNNIGACFAEGLGVEKDLKLAARWLALSAEAGDPAGQRDLAALYLKRDGAAQHHAAAAEPYCAGADAGEGPAP